MPEQEVGTRPDLPMRRRKGSTIGSGFLITTVCLRTTDSKCSYEGWRDSEAQRKALLYWHRFPSTRGHNCRTRACCGGKAGVRPLSAGPASPSVFLERTFRPAVLSAIQCWNKAV